MTTQTDPYIRTNQLHNQLQNHTALEQAHSAYQTCVDALERTPNTIKFSKEDEIRLCEVYAVVLRIFVDFEKLPECNRALRKFAEFSDINYIRQTYKLKYTETLVGAYLDREKHLEAARVLTTTPDYRLSKLVNEVAMTCLLKGDLAAADILLRKYPEQNGSARASLARQYINRGNILAAEQLLSENIDNPEAIAKLVFKAYILQNKPALTKQLGGHFWDDTSLLNQIFSAYYDQARNSARSKHSL